MYYDVPITRHIGTEKRGKYFILMNNVMSKIFLIVSNVQYKFMKRIYLPVYLINISHIYILYIPLMLLKTLLSLIEPLSTIRKLADIMFYCFERPRRLF